ncbi:hypothetical protein GCM10023213_07210 [Prosthecobacter algae]|uniref:Uncharacterized protein n=2 Tax=Prosthecobacter algae TaxID=1144682 RepID=A0ABP9NWM6_9BACT
MSSLINEEERLLEDLKKVQEKIEEYRAAKWKQLHPDAKPPHTLTPVSDSLARKVVQWGQKWNLKVAENLKDKNKVNLPATFNYSMPAGGEDTWAVDGGISVNRDLGSDFMYGAWADYHYNEAAANLKDTFQAGLSLDWIIGNESAEETHYFRSTFGFKRDNKIGGEGIGADLNYIPYFPEIWIGRELDLKLMKVMLAPIVGAQMATGNGAQGFADGERYSVRVGLGISASILPDMLGNRLTVDSQIVYWNNVSRSGAFDIYDREQWSWTTGLTYWLFTPDIKRARNTILDQRDQHFGITAKYTRGDNPDEGFIGSDLMTLGFAVRF